MVLGQGRRNIAGRDDIAPDALRQRRDLYALAIGLCIYNLAGGYVLTDTTVASIIPVKLSHPWVVLLAAWFGFAYFWWRFWLISEARPFGDFHEDAMWQAGNSRTGRALAAEFTGPINFFGNERSAAQNAESLKQPRGPIPKFKLEKGRPTIDLTDLRYHGKNQSTVTQSYGHVATIAKGHRLRFWWAFWLGYVRAAYRERAFSDYTVPHVFAMFTGLTGIWHAIAY